MLTRDSLIEIISRQLSSVSTIVLLSSDVTKKTEASKVNEPNGRSFQVVQGLGCQCNRRSANQISISATGQVRTSVQKLNGDMAFLSFYHHEHIFAEAFSLTCISLKSDNTDVSDMHKNLKTIHTHLDLKISLAPCLPGRLPNCCYNLIRSRQYLAAEETEGQV